MKNNLNQIIQKYIELFPEEKLNQLQEFIKKSKEDIYDSKNTVGHITASGFIFSKEDRKILLLDHKKLKKFIQPGGHVEPEDKELIDTVKR